MTRLLLIACVVVAAGTPAFGQAVDRVSELIELVRAKPPDMERDAWKEKRREAARELGTLGDKRAVAVLIEVVDQEQFDIVGEIAIEALGKLGDDSAADTLRRVNSDPSRDRDQRKAAQRALRKLGQTPETETDESDSVLLRTPGGGTEDLLAGEATKATAPKGPGFAKDTLAASQRLTLALGGAAFEYDTVQSRPTVQGDLAADYAAWFDRTAYAYGYGGRGGVIAGAVDFDGDDSAARSIVFNGVVDGEGRYYVPNFPVYGIGLGAVGVSLNGTRIDRPNDTDTKELTAGVDVELAVGAGYGRIVDIGEALRLRRIEQALKNNRMLGRPVTADLAARIFEAWWGLRGEQGAHSRLLVTVTMLREAGVLLGEPNASTTYKILQVLLDGQLNHRPSGLDVHVGYAGSYVARDDLLGVDEGFGQDIVGRVRYGLQADSAESEIVAQGLGRWRVLADDTEFSPWLAYAELTWRNYLYNDNFDPIGALEFAGHASIADDGDPDDNANTGYRLGALLGWSWIPSRASRFRVAGDVAFESGELFVGIFFDARYGFLDSAFVGQGAFPSAIP